MEVWDSLKLVLWADVWRAWNTTSINHHQSLITNNHHCYQMSSDLIPNWSLPPAVLPWAPSKESNAMGPEWHSDGCGLTGLYAAQVPSGAERRSTWWVSGYRAWVTWAKRHWEWWVGAWWVVSAFYWPSLVGWFQIAGWRLLHGLVEMMGESWWGWCSWRRMGVLHHRCIYATSGEDRPPNRQLCMVELVGHFMAFI